MLTWAVYIISWMFSVCAGAEHPLFYGNLLVMTVATLVLAVLFKKKKKNIFRITMLLTERLDIFPYVLFNNNETYKFLYYPNNGLY